MRQCANGSPKMITANIERGDNYLRFPWSYSLNAALKYAGCRPFSFSIDLIFADLIRYGEYNFTHVQKLELRSSTEIFLITLLPPYQQSRFGTK